MTRASLAMTVPLLVAIGAPRAHADDPPCSAEADAVKQMKKRDPSLKEPQSESAKAHMEAAKRAYGVQQYDKAIDEYTAAGLDDDAPLILYDLGQTYRNAKDYDKAIRQYQLFIERGKPGPEVRSLVECWVSTMRAELDHAASTAPPTGPAADALNHADDHSVGPPVGASGPQTQGPTERVDHGARPSRWTGTRKVAAGIAIVGIGGLVAGTVFGIQTSDLRNQADSLCPTNPCAKADEANALTDRANTRQTLSTVSLGGGAALAAGAVVLWFIGAPSPVSGNGDSALVPQIGPTFAGVAYARTF